MILKEGGGGTYVNYLVGFSNCPAPLWSIPLMAVHPTWIVSHRVTAVLLLTEGMRLVPMVCCEKQLRYEHKGKYAEKKGERSLKRRQGKITEIRSQENSLKKGKEKEPVKSKDWA